MMRAHRFAAAGALAFALALIASPQLAGAAKPATPAKPTEALPPFAEGDQVLELHSTSSDKATHAAGSLARTATDTFYLYGGPNSLQGKFENADGAADWQGWQGVDLSETPVYWQVSTFNAETLGNHGPGNHALWCGQESDQVSGWSTAPGYGNQWNQVALYESDVVTDLAVGQTVDLDFVMHYDTEPAYDYFHVEYDSAGIWVSVLSVDGSSGTNGEFPAPGVAFSDLATRPIIYSGNDYGFREDRIRIRLRFESDGAWSDEDGIWPTMGAVQVDDVTLTHRDGSFTEDFEGEAPYLFNLRTAPVHGDFSDVYPRFQENLDPCRSNDTPVIGFIDYGQEVRNGPGLDGSTSTGGATSYTWDYGIPGGYVLNVRGGLSGGDLSLHNGIVSPPIDWDLPGSADDDPGVRGAFLRYSMWRHLPLTDAVFYRWHVRSRASDSAWSPWKNSPFIYYANTPQWRTFQNDVTSYLQPDASQIQAMFTVIFASNLDYPSGDSTPSPIFDNVTLAKYRIGGPSLTVRTLELPQDAFPANASIAASTMSERDALDVRFDMARDINTTGAAIVAGDSIFVTAAALLPGTTVTGVNMKWALRRNPFFEDAIRSAPAGAYDTNVDVSGAVWTGEVIGQAVGVTRPYHHFDLPDEDFLYPGDKLHISFEAIDSAGGVTTLPASTEGFGQWNEDGEDAYERDFTVHALPSIRAEGQPSMLVVESFGGLAPPERGELASTLHQLGYVEGVDYDLYVMRLASFGSNSGIGAAGPRGHGATPAELANYSTLVLSMGQRAFSQPALSDGSGSDKSDDLGLLTAWKALPGQRNTVHFGEHLASSLTSSLVPSGPLYLQDILGVSVSSSDVKGDIDGQAAPRVAGLLPAFTTTFAAFGGCPAPRTFDSILPLPGAVAGHAFLSSTGSPFAAAAASVIYDRIDAQGHRKVDFTFPFGLAAVSEEMNAPGEATSARTNLFAEILAYLGAPPPSGTPTSAPIALRTSLSVAPNPFNPRTEILLELERTTALTLEVFDLRGARVAVLHRGELAAGNHRFVWSGDDTHGKGVASGVYLVRADGEQIALSKKVALVR